MAKSDTGLIQWRLNYFFISNALQEGTKNTDILPAFSADHSPMIFSLSKPKDVSKGKALWKPKKLFSNSNLWKCESAYFCHS